jgi:hypothetical protein
LLDRSGSGLHSWSKKVEVSGLKVERLGSEAGVFNQGVEVLDSYPEISSK